MRNKRKKYGFIIVILVPIIFIAAVALAAKNTENNRKLSREYADKLVLPAEGEYADAIDKITKDLSLVPPEYLKVLYDKQVFIRTVVGSITDGKEFTEVVDLRKYKDIYKDYGGLFMGDHIIIRRDEMYGGGVAIHEVGHAVDHLMFNNISNSAEFKGIYNKEAEKFYNKIGQEHYLENEMEYFAEAFNYYYYSYDVRKYLKSRAPETYEFIRKLQNRKSS
jgi:hypothetical protein